MTSTDLKKYLGLKTIYEHKKGVFEERRGKAEDLKAVQLDGLPHAKNKENYTLEEFIDYCESEDIKELMKLDGILRRIEKQIQELNDSKHINILQKHYIEGKSLKKIAVEMNREYSGLRKEHVKALKEYDRIGKFKIYHKKPPKTT